MKQFIEEYKLHYLHIIIGRKAFSVQSLSTQPSPKNVPHYTSENGFNKSRGVEFAIHVYSISIAALSYIKENI
jgi:hypothetical protein